MNDGAKKASSMPALDIKGQADGTSASHHKSIPIPDEKDTKPRHTPKKHKTCSNEIIVNFADIYTYLANT